MAGKACHVAASATQVGLTQALGRKMKITVGALSVGVAAIGAFLFLSGVGGLLVDYVPTVAADVVAGARERSFQRLFGGVFVMLVASALCGLATRTSPKLAATSAVVLSLASLFPLAFWLFA